LLFIAHVKIFIVFPHSWFKVYVFIENLLKPFSYNLDSVYLKNMESTCVQVFRDFVSVEGWKQRMMDDHRIDVREKNGYLIFNMSKEDEVQVLTPLQRVCRGLIVDKEDPTRIVSLGHLRSPPFSTQQWFTMTEEQRHAYLENQKNGWTLNTQIHRVTLALDGTQIRVWYDKGVWHISTTRVIDAGYAPIAIGTRVTFKDLMYEYLNIKVDEEFQVWCEDQLHQHLQYTFVLFHPSNQIICKAEEKKLYCVLIRDAHTLESTQHVLKEGTTIPWQSLHDMLVEVHQVAPKREDESYLTLRHVMDAVQVKGWRQRYPLGSGLMIYREDGERWNIPFLEYEEMKGIKGSVRFFKPIYRWCELDTKELDRTNFLTYFPQYTVPFQAFDDVKKRLLTSMQYVYRDVYVKHMYKTNDTQIWFYRNALRKVHALYIKKKETVATRPVSGAKCHVTAADFKTMWDQMDAAERCFLMTRYMKLDTY
jgi:hypothetical protein